MTFEARKLRVQLPCGPQTLIACVFGSCRLPSVITCIYRTPWGCPTWISQCLGGRSVYCEFVTRPTFPTCGATWDTETLYERTDLIQPQLEVEELDILREQLEGQLKEVVSAQQAIAKQNKTK